METEMVKIVKFQIVLSDKNYLIVKHYMV